MTIHCSQQYLLVILIIRSQNPEAVCRTPTEHQDTALPPQTISPSSPPPPSHLPNNLETAVCPQINIQCSEPPLSQISPKDSTQAPTPFLQPPARALLISISKKSSAIRENRARSFLPARGILLPTESPVFILPLRWTWLSEKASSRSHWKERAANRFYCSRTGPWAMRRGSLGRSPGPGFPHGAGRRLRVTACRSFG